MKKEGGIYKHLNKENRKGGRKREKKHRCKPVLVTQKEIEKKENVQAEKL